MIQVLKQGKGQLLVVRRPLKSEPPWIYLPCDYCLGFYNKATMERHLRACSSLTSAQDNTDHIALWLNLTKYLSSTKAEVTEEMHANGAEVNESSGLLLLIIRISTCIYMYLFL